MTKAKIRQKLGVFVDSLGSQVELRRIGITNYFATSDGHIVSHKRPSAKLLRERKGDYGHCSTKLDNKAHQVHRLVYEAFLGKIPDGLEVDHIDRNPSNNVPSNLRIATRLENARNNSGHKGSSSVYCGVSYHKRRKTWQARIRIDGHLKHLGSFKTEKEAYECRVLAARESFGRYAPV